MAHNSQQSCKNCGNPLTGLYCSHCGQKSTEKNVSLKIMLEDVIGDVFSVDSKIIRSLKPLLFKPGSLSLDYTIGKRDSYVKPFRLYLFSSLLFFFFTFLNSGSNNGNGDGSASALDSLATLYPVDTLNPNGNLVIHLRDGGIGLSYFLPDSTNPPSSLMDTSESFIDKQFSHMTYGELKAKEGRLGANFRESVPNVLFFLVPVFALLFKLLHIRQKKFYVGHLIFVFHLHAFFFILLLILSLINFLIGLVFTSALLEIILSIIAFIIFVVYLFLAMRKVYGQKAWITAIKLITIIFLYITIILISLILFVFISIWLL